MKSLVNNKDRVLKILQDYKSTRDSDKKLWLAFMVNHHDLRKELGDKSYRKLREIILKKETPTFETISRIRRKLQEIYEQIRGENYKEKQLLADEVRDNIKDL